MLAWMCLDYKTYSVDTGTSLLFHSTFEALGGIVDPVSDGLEPVESAGPAGAVPLPFPPLLTGEATIPWIKHHLTAKVFR